MYARESRAAARRDIRRTDRPRPGFAAPEETLLELQRAAGNEAVGELVVQRMWPFDDEEGEEDEEPPAEATEAVDEGYGGGEGGSPGWGGEETGAGGGEGSGGYSEGYGESESYGEGGESEDYGYTPAEEGESSEAEGEFNAENAEPETSETPTNELDANDQFDQAVAMGDNAQALNVVLYMRGFGGPNVASITYAPGQGDAGLTSGPMGQPQAITIGPSAFEAGMPYCASIIGHEVQHANQRTQSPAIENPDVREFLAYSWEVLDSGEAVSPADKRANAVQAMKRYSNMDGFDQATYMDRYEAVKRVYNSIPAPEAQ